MAQIDAIKLELKSGYIAVVAYGERFDNGFTCLEHLPYPCKKDSEEILRNHGKKSAKRMNVKFFDLV